MNLGIVKQIHQYMKSLQFTFNSKFIKYKSHKKTPALCLRQITSVFHKAIWDYSGYYERFTAALVRVLTLKLIRHRNKSWYGVRHLAQLLVNDSQKLDVGFLFYLGRFRRKPNIKHLGIFICFAGFSFRNITGF